MKKCDVIIPVYKSPEWVKLCVYALCRNTTYINKIYLINDCDDMFTMNCLNNLKNKYSVIEVVQNEKNLGFVKTSNKGLKLSCADYVLLLNTDCIVTSRTIEKLIHHLEKDDSIGLICPISSNAANLTLEMFEGFTYEQMDLLLERKFIGQCFDACTVVGNCLMITKKCIQEVGYLDEIYGTGYGEETDYQFKAMEKGFKAKVAIDSYVFHKSEVSFGTSKEKQEKLKKNQAIFFERWGAKYQKLMTEYRKNDPIQYILSNLGEEDKKLDFEFLIYLIGFTKAAGGINMTVDLVNYLAMNNVPCNILYGFSDGYDEIMLFAPIQVNHVHYYTFKKIVSTIYFSTYYAKMLADQYKIPLISFAQGYEPYFENGADYGVAELSYKLPDHILTISNYLKEKYKSTFQMNSTVISNGISYDLLYKENIHTELKVVTMIIRNNYLKGDFIQLDLFKRLTKDYPQLEINLLCNNSHIKLPFYEKKQGKVNVFYGPFTRKEIADVLQKSDLYIDTSLTEGFGLMPLEAMASGNVVIVSDSGGIRDYIKDQVNGFVVPEVNNVEAYLNKIDILLKNKKMYHEMKENMKNTSKKFDYDAVVEKYIDYFSQDHSRKDIKLSLEEELLYREILDTRFKISNNYSKNFVYKLCKKVPQGPKRTVKKLITKLYEFTNEH